MITKRYYEEILKVLQKINETQTEKIKSTSKMVAETMENDGIIYIFGCGHSHLIALDSFYRAGGLANVSAILDTDLMLHNGAAKSSAMEKMGEIAPYILDRYCLTQKDILIIISTSGINGVPIEMAQYAHSKGIKTISITSSSYFAEKSRHSSGKLLCESTDAYIDNFVPHGDSTIDITGCKTKMGSVSTASSSFILQSVLMEASELASLGGTEIPVYMSGNIEGGTEFNKMLINKYQPVIKHL